MKFEEMEKVWAAQSAPSLAPVAAALDLSVIKRTVEPELRRRSRLLNYGIFVSVLGLILLPLLTLANRGHASYLTGIWYWVNPAFSFLVTALVFVHLLRKKRRQQELVRQSTQSIRALTMASIASLAEELSDHRNAWWIVSLLSAVQLVALWFNFPVMTLGWAPFLLRASAVVGLPGLMLLVGWRHLRVHVGPQIERQRELLRQLE